MVVNSIDEYIKEICDVNSKLTKNGVGVNQILLFRGQSNEHFELVPSIGRGYGEDGNKSVLYEERNLIEMAKYRLPEIFHERLQPIELLSLLQHHGIPTRLLDVTENALVALYFACSKDFDSDGEVIVFKDNEQDVANFPIINAIAETYKFCVGEITSLVEFEKSVLSQSYFSEQRYLIETCYPSEDSKTEWFEKCCKSVHFIYAPIHRLRQQMQQGRYILFSNKISHDCDSSKTAFLIPEIEPISKDADCVAKCIKIPADKKKKILNELALFGVSEEQLFCDNIDIVCKSIFNTFSRNPRGNVYFVN